jgi:hypothetical protein
MGRTNSSVVQRGYVGSREIKYRYTCEHCGKETDRFSGKYEEEYVKSSKTSISSMLTIKKIDVQAYTTVKEGAEIAPKHIEKIFDDYKKNYENGNPQGIVFEDNPFMTDIYNKMFKAGGVCPECGKKQSWYPATHIKPSVSKRMVNWAICIGLLTLAVAFCVNSGIGGKKVIPLSLLYGGIGVVVGAIFGVIMHYAKKPKVDKNAKPTVPEIEWGEIVVTDSGRLKEWKPEDGEE